MGVVLLFVELMQEDDNDLGTYVDYLLRGTTALLIVVIAEALDYILGPNAVNPVDGTIHVYYRVGLATPRKSVVQVHGKFTLTFSLIRADVHL